MSEEWTCGKGLAQNAALPATLARLMGAMGGLLESHTKALDVGQASGRAEYEAYCRLADEFRALEPPLRTVAEMMAGHLDLAMADHDAAALASADAVGAFRAFVDAEQEALSLLEKRVREHRGMLGG
jgi:hypothetical protein